VSPLVRELGIDSAPESLSDGEFLLHEIKTFLTWLAKGRPVVLEVRKRYFISPTCRSKFTSRIFEFVDDFP
jgi:hypothetical protein